MARIFDTQWKENSGADSVLFTYDYFSETFLERFFPIELTGVKAQEFMNLK